MSTGSVQRRNDEMVSLLESDFCRWREFMADGARLLSAVQATHRQGGGILRWGWMADSCFLFGQAAAAAIPLTPHAIDAADYAATLNGGPYINFNGATEYYDAGDNAEFEVGTRNFLVWHWVYGCALDTNDRVITSKDGGGNNHQWCLQWNLAGTAFRFQVSNAGAAWTSVTSTYPEAINTWYFVAGFFTASDANGLRIYVGASTDDALTIDAAVSPANVWNGGASDFEIGSERGGNDLWEGYIGIGHGRLNVPGGAAFAGVDGHISRLFHMTRWKYMA